MRKRCRANPRTGWVSVSAGICFATHESLSFRRAGAPQLSSCRTVDASLQSRWWHLLGARRRWPGSAESSCMVETTSFAASPTSYSAGLPCAMLLLLVSTSVTLACFASTADDGTRGATARSGTLRVSSRHKPIMRAVAAIHPTSVKSCSARASLAVLPPAA